MVGNGAIAATRRTEPAPQQPREVGQAPAEAAAAAAAGPGATPDAKTRLGPGADPKFATLKKDVQRKKRTVATSHPPARTEAVAAQDAARAPKDDEEAQGKTANAEKMNEAKPAEFDKETFIKAVEKAIADKAPKNLDEADKFSDSGKAAEVKAEVQGRVGEGKTDSAEQIATTTAAPPDTSAAVTKTVVPLATDRPPRTPGNPDPANAVPDKLPPSATDMSAGPAQVERQMTDAQVTEPQLKKANEPSFTNALNEKKVAEQHSDVAPGQLRKSEAGQLRESTAQAKRIGTAAMGAIGAHRVRTGQQVGAGKTGAKTRDEEKRAQVTGILQGVFDKMKTDVEAILNGLDAVVDKQFTDGEKQARDEFTAEHKRKMEEYKDRRYSGAVGKLRWFDDLFTGLPDEADRIFDNARNGYIKRMRNVISDVATTIGTKLNEAKRRIAQGRTELQAEVTKLPKDLQSIGREAAAEFSDKFDELTQSVDDKGTELVDTLATKYTETLKSVDEEIAEEKEKNKGLVDKAIDAVKGVVNTILELKRLLLSVLAKAAQAVLGILGDPIGFLRNLVSAVGAGLRQFMANIGKHLQQGIMSWLLGRAAEAGLQLPDKFDTRGVLTMLASLLGLTWQSIRARITRKVPEKAVAAAETAVPLVAEVRKRGVAGMWEDLQTRIGDLRKNLMDKVIEYVSPTIVMAGITWVLSLLNPASAFVRAVKLIIDIVKFIVTQARQIIDFVNAVLDAVIAIAKGAGGGVPGLIERALARAIPVLLGFLASLLGIGGIAAKVKQIVQAMSRPVGRAIDWVVDKIVGLAKKLWAKIKPKRDKPKSDKAKPAKPKQAKGPKKPRRPRKDPRHPKDVGRAPVRDPRKGKDGKPKQPQGKQAPQPVVTVPFHLAGEAHKLTFTPRGSDVDVTMASKRGMPLADKFQEAHWALAHLNAYIDTIKDEVVKRNYQERFGNELKVVTKSDVKEYKVIYKTVFPHRELESKELTEAQQKQAEAVQRLVNRANALLAAIVAWGAQQGIPDLSQEEIDNTIEVKAKAIWEERFLEIKAKVDEIVGRFNYRGQQLRYVGSMSRGWRGPHKGLTRFDLKDFDVDLYVVDRAEFERLEQTGMHRNRAHIMDKDKVFPTIEDTPDLLRVSNAIRKALEAAFPSVAGISDSTIVLRKEAP